MSSFGYVYNPHKIKEHEKGMCKRIFTRIESFNHAETLKAVAKKLKIPNILTLYLEHRLL